MLKKRISAGLAGLALAGALLLSACATTSTTAASSPAEVAANACASLQAVQIVLTTPGAIDADVQAEIEQVTPVITAVCSSNVSTTDLLSLDSAIPILLKVVQLLPIDDAEKQAATLAVALVRAALAPVLK